jgi:hypothetical protein
MSPCLHVKLLPSLSFDHSLFFLPITILMHLYFFQSFSLSDRRDISSDDASVAFETSQVLQSLQLNRSLPHPTP